MTQRIDAIKSEETHWREEAERRSDPKKKLLYNSIADVAALKADELRLRASIRPEGELARSIVEEKAESNDLTRFERFKRWARRNLGGISIYQRKKERKAHVAHQDRSDARGHIHRVYPRVEQKPVHRAGHPRAVVQIHQQQHEILVFEQPVTPFVRETQRQRPEHGGVSKHR